MDEKNNPPAEPKPSEVIPSTPSGTPSSTTHKARELLARHYSERFGSSLSGTSTALIVWLASLLLIWGGYILPLPGKLARLEAIESEVPESTSKLRTWEQKLRDPAYSAQEPELNLEEQRSQRRSFQGNLQATKREGQDLSEDLEKIDTPFGTLEIHKKLVPALWAILFAGLFTFYLHRRILLLAMLGRAIRIHVSELGDRLEDLRGIGAWAPFWLAPLPPASRDSQMSRDDIRAVLGWGSREGWRSIASILVLAAILALYMSVLFISWTILEMEVDERQLRVTAIVLLGLLYCLTIGGLWLLRPICYDGFPDRMLANLPARRAFLSLAGLTLLVSGAALLYPRRVISKLLPETHLLPRHKILLPRYKKPIRARRKPLGAALRNSFQLNKRRSNVIHYVDSEGWSAGAEGMAEYNLQQLEPAEIAALLGAANQPAPSPPEATALSIQASEKEPLRPVRLNRSQAARITERLAFEEAQAGKLIRALDLLRLGIERDTAFKRYNLKRPSYRLYDLFAGLAARTGDAAADRIRDLRGYAEQQWPMDPGIQRRLNWWANAWKSPESGWKKRWTEEKIPWALPQERSSGDPPTI